MKSISNKRNKVIGRLSGIAFAGMVIALAACGEKPQAPPQQTAPPKLFQQERGALEKAKGVEQTEAASAENSKQEIEKQTQ